MMADAQITVFVEVKFQSVFDAKISACVKFGH